MVNTYDCLEKYRPVVVALGEEGMSSDESGTDETGKRVYRRTRPRWRSPRVARVHDVLDDAYELHSSGRRDIRGPTKRSREYSGIVHNSQPVRGMSHNMYWNVWMEEQDAVYIHEVLMPDVQDMALDIDDDVQVAGVSLSAKPRNDKLTTAMQIMRNDRTRARRR